MECHTFQDRCLLSSSGGCCVVTGFPSVLADIVNQLCLLATMTPPFGAISYSTDDLKKE